jgi:hypothetical protein
VNAKLQQNSAINRVLVRFAAAVFATLPLFAAAETDWPHDIDLAVELKLTGAMATDGRMRVSGDLTVKNPGHMALSLESPKNRLALAFVVFDSLGNVVAPKGLAKVDPAFQTQILSAGGSFTHHFESLDYLSGSALFGYELSPKESYSIVAIYRPAGLKGPGFATREVSTSQVAGMIHSPGLTNYPQTEAFKYFVEWQTNAEWHRQQTNLLAITAFDEGSDRSAFQYWVNGDGLESDVRTVYDWAHQALGQKQLSASALQDLRAVIGQLPTENATPPIERLVIVSWSRGTNWLTTSYDRQSLPAGMRQVYGLIGDRQAGNVTGN